MTRPPRPKYPTDSKNYHEARRPGHAHTIRLPEELLDTYLQLKKSLGARSSHADVIRFLFDAAESAITSVIQASEPQLIPDSQLHGFATNGEEQREGNVMEVDPGAESEPEECSDGENADAPVVLDVTDSDDEDVMCLDSQAPSIIRDAAGRTYPDATTAFWSKGKVLEFFQRFMVFCPTEGCSRKFLPPKISEFQQLWSIAMKCPVGHNFLFLTGELEREHGVPDITGKLYHSFLCSGMTHTSLESLCGEVGLHVPRRAHFFDFQSGKRRKPGWIAATLDLWNDKKRRLQEDLVRQGNLFVSVFQLSSVNALL
ncbi:hypothetical protein R1sor_026242 [Riccia sorocarpa]|uniref:Transposase n=1 Tax=Riccia sorocarpa TaxID=122646 RepID=A0ABD3GGI2_9MARC